MNFNQVPEFEKELKQFQKKWRSLFGDLESAKRRITDLYIPQDDKDDLVEYRNAFFNGKRATILQQSLDGTEVVKMRLDCASLGGSDKIRLVFITIRNADEVKFIELFSKSDKQREDVGRIKKYF